MKILFDYQIFELQRFGGISNAYVNLIKNFPPSVGYDIAIKDSENIHLIDSNLLKTGKMHSYDSFLANCHFKGKRRIYNALKHFCPSIESAYKNRMHSIKLLERGNYDIFHPTFFDDYFQPHLHGKPFVLTIYDMISELFFDKNNMQTVNKRKMAKSAAHIVAISEKTKEDIVNILHVDESKVSVVYLAANDIRQDRMDPIVEEKYILFVGIRDGYKNFLPMVRALAPVFRKDRALKLVCTGNDFTNDELEEFARCKVSDQVVHLYPTDSELRNLYQNAQCFVYPSLYEGFGIPILEAWQCDCPVLLNNKSCFPEIACDAAVYFNLDNEQSDLAETMDRFLNMSANDRRKLINAQRKRLAEFSWKKSSEQLWEVYQKVLCRYDS